MDATEQFYEWTRNNDMTAYKILDRALTSGDIAAVNHAAESVSLQQQSEGRPECSENTLIRFAEMLEHKGFGHYEAIEFLRVFYLNYKPAPSQSAPEKSEPLHIRAIDSDSDREREQALLELRSAPGKSEPQTREYTLLFAFEGENVLLLRKSESHYNPLFRGRWTAPGGKIEAGELPLEAAIREFREEAGLVVHSPRYVLSFACNCDPTEPEHRVHVFASLLDATSGVAKGSESEPVKTFKTYDLPKTVWYVPALIDIAKARLKQPPAQAAPGKSEPITVGYISEPVFPSCHVCGEQMIDSCPKCGATTGCTPDAPTTPSRADESCAG